MQYWLVMPAAGTGRRFGSGVAKQYAPLAGRTVIEWSLAPFMADTRCRGIMLALAADDEHWPRLAPRFPPGRISTTPGGAERCDSVRLALAALPAANDDWVLVHDAARPCLPGADLDALLAQGALHPVGALLAVPLADTLKRSAPGNQVEATVPRAALWRALTPQMFRHGVLSAALAAATAEGVRPTDESQALERQGLQPLLVAGSGRNLKITTADDLVLAAALLATGVQTT
jgi:2-C-methyl-D-erythritol 4-phosphate cytidylyltransferase